MVKDTEGYEIYTPSSWQVHNIYFSRQTKDWISNDVVVRHQRLVKGFYSHRRLNKFYDPYMEAISPHYQKIFLGYAVKFAIRLLVIFLDHPQRYRDNGTAVMMRYFTSLNAQLWTRIYQCNRHNMVMPLPEKGEMVVEKKYLIMHAEHLIDALYPEAVKLLPKYQEFHRKNSNYL
jgi:hypothetical protein